MRAGSGALAAALQADLADQLRESPMHCPFRQPLAGPADEERRAVRRRPVSVSQVGVLAERAGCARVQRHLALLLSLAAHPEHAVVEVDVLAVEAERFAGPYPGRSS